MKPKKLRGREFCLNKLKSEILKIMLLGNIENSIFQESVEDTL